MRWVGRCTADPRARRARSTLRRPSNADRSDRPGRRTNPRELPEQPKRLADTQVSRSVPSPRVPAKVRERRPSRQARLQGCSPTRAHMQGWPTQRELKWPPD